MENKPLIRSIDSLQKIYAVIIALAIGKTLQQVFGYSSWEEIGKNFTISLPALLSFFCFVIPFYHGMNRHLDKCYIEKESSYSKMGLLIDFFIFCIEASLLFVFANFIILGKESFIILGLLLAIDIVWAIIAHIINYRDFKPTVLYWALLNLITLGLGFYIYTLEAVIPIDITWLLFVLLFFRSVADYGIMRKFYFP